MVLGKEEQVMSTVISFLISALIALPFVLEVFKAQRKTEAIFGRHYHTHFCDIPNGYKYLPTWASVALVLMLFGFQSACIAIFIAFLFNWACSNIVFSWQLKWWRARYMGMFLAYGASFVFFWFICLYGVLEYR